MGMTTMTTGLVVGAVTFSEVWESTRTLGFVTGACAVAALVVLCLLVCLWRLWRARRRLIELHDSQGGSFQVSFEAVRTHLTALVRQCFPQLTLRRVRVYRRRGGYGVVLVALAEDTVNLAELRDQVHRTLLRSLETTMGMQGLFGDVRVIISGLRVSGKRDYQETLSEARRPVEIAPDEAPLSPLPEPEPLAPEQGDRPEA
ncbi:MAG: hypothetical protein ACI4WT_03370 [Oligosphaeraceae bacterium]